MLWKQRKSFINTFNLINIHWNSLERYIFENFVELSVFKDRSTIIVPDYTNLNLKEVKKRLKKDKLVLDESDIMYFTEDNISRDIVYHQKPKAGEKVLEGSKLIINVSLGQSDGVFKVPNEIIGLLLPDVILKLKKNRFLIGEIDTVYNKDLLRIQKNHYHIFIVYIYTLNCSYE